eukprot:XP_014789594.1 PREDICTED: tigger transposable element-derived protein 4-like [Octopus bimaculoides]
MQLKLTSMEAINFVRQRCSFCWNCTSHRTTITLMKLRSTFVHYQGIHMSTRVARKQCEALRWQRTCVTLMVACNMNGDKEDWLLIGKAGSSRCFKNVKTLPIQYDFSTSIWMTEKIYRKWFKSWDRRLQESGRQVVILLDNCSLHVVLKNITLKFLPHKTSVLQPCDMGISKTLKAYFKHEMQEIIDVMEDTKHNIFAQEVAKQIIILDAMYMLSIAC